MVTVTRCGVDPKYTRQFPWLQDQLLVSDRSSSNLQLNQKADNLGCPDVVSVPVKSSEDWNGTFPPIKDNKKIRISIWYSLLVTVSGRGYMVYPTSPWGVTTDEIDRQAHDFIVANGMGIQWKLRDLLWHAGICFGKHDPARVMYGNVSVIVLAICLHSTVSPTFISWSYAWSNIETQHIICQV